MSINKVIEDYREAKNTMELIINRHLEDAFSEIRNEFGSAPTSVILNINTVKRMDQKYPSGVYCGCEVSVCGD